MGHQTLVVPKICCVLHLYRKRHNLPIAIIIKGLIVMFARNFKHWSFPSCLLICGFLKLNSKACHVLLRFINCLPQILIPWCFVKMLELFHCEVCLPTTTAFSTLGCSFLTEPIFIIIVTVLLFSYRSHYFNRLGSLISGALI